MTTKIEWTDMTWNPVTGCTKVSAGCRNCYAEALAPRVFAGQRTRIAETVDGHENSRPRRFTDVRCHPERLYAPLHWRKPRRVFTNSMSDLFHEAVPDQFIDDVFAVMALASRHTFQVLTKRPDRMCEYIARRRERVLGQIARHALRIESTWSKAELLTCYACSMAEHERRVSAWPLPNVWLGVSCEDQATADERIPILLDTPAAVRWISAEPLLGPIDLTPWIAASDERPSLAWCVTGGESGPKARPCDVAWIRSIVEQCRAAGVPVFVKQLGANVRDRNDAGFDGDQIQDWPNPEVIPLHGLPIQGDPVRVKLRHPKGGEPAEWPEDLRIRDLPRSAATRNP